MQSLKLYKPSLKNKNLSIYFLQIYEEQYNEILKSRPKQPVNSSTNKLFQRFSIYCEPTVYKPIIILVILFIFQQFSGGYVIIFYAVDIFKSLGGNFGAGFDQFTSLIMIGLIRFVMSLVSSLLSKRFGRKPLLCASGVGMTICTLGVAGYMSFFTHLNLDFIPLIFVLGYVTFASFGFFVVPWGLISELFPVKVRATMGGVMITWAYICMFFIVKMFPTLLEFFGVSVMFVIYSLFSFAGVLFTIFYLPETFGKTFSEIEAYFEN